MKGGKIRFVIIVNVGVVRIFTYTLIVYKAHMHANMPTLGGSGHGGMHMLIGDLVEKLHPLRLKLQAFLVIYHPLMFLL